MKMLNYSVRELPDSALPPSLPVCQAATSHALPPPGTQHYQTGKDASYNGRQDLLLRLPCRFLKICLMELY